MKHRLLFATLLMLGSAHAADDVTSLLKAADRYRSVSPRKKVAP